MLNALMQTSLKDSVWVCLRVILLFYIITQFSMKCQLFIVKIYINNMYALAQWKMCLMHLHTQCTKLCHVRISVISALRYTSIYSSNLKIIKNDSHCPNWLSLLAFDSFTIFSLPVYFKTFLDEKRFTRIDFLIFTNKQLIL